MEILLQRPLCRDRDRARESVFGVATVDLELPRGLPTAGYATDGCHPTRATSQMLVRAAWLEDDAGEAVALVSADLLSGSRFLWERVGGLLAEQVGLDRRRLLLCGTHTHTGPGGYFGDALFDVVTSASPGFDPALAEHLAQRVAAAVGQARLTARPARVAMVETRLWGLVRQASLPGFQATPEAACWFEPGMPGHGAPEGLEAPWRCVDPRVRLLVFREPEGALLGVVAVLPAHATALGHGHRFYDGDWYGVMAREAGRVLGAAVLPLSGTEADTNVLAPDLDQGFELCTRVGMRAAEAVVAAVEGCAAEAELALRVRFGLLRPEEEPRMAGGAIFGRAALGGAEDGRSFLYTLGIARPGDRSDHYPPEHHQHPKAPAVGLLQDFLSRRHAMDGPVELPLHVLELGPLCLALVPFEVDCVAAHRLARALGEPARPVAVVGCAGGYGGYAVTPEAYALQDYEGASTLWGARTVEVLAERLAALEPLSADLDDPDPAAFHTGPHRHWVTD